jgi:hypothetical protein
MCRGEAQMSELTFMKQDNINCSVSGREYNFPPQKKSAAQLMALYGALLGMGFK